MSDINNRLAEFVRSTIAVKGLNYREVAAKSGGLITYSAVYDIINGRSKNPKTSTLRGLAKGLGEPEEKIFAISSDLRISVEDLDRIELESMYRRRSELSPKRKAEFRRLIEMVDRELDLLYEEELKEQAGNSHTNGKK